MATSAAAPVVGWERAPSLNEYSLLALTNMKRAQPSLGGGTEPVAPPLVWSGELAAAARFHTYDMTVNGCRQHDSCNGELWWKRVQRYYPGWSALAENVGGGLGMRDLHSTWLASPGHRSHLLSPNYREFGAGVALGPRTDFGQFTYGTEDFGARAAVAIPAIPAATVLAPQNWSASPLVWEPLVNYYDSQGRAPVSVSAIVDGQPQVLTRVAGTTTHGTWSGTITTQPASSHCKRVYFEVRRADSATFRWPATGDIRIGREGTCWDPHAPMTGGVTPPTTTPTTPTTAPASAPVVVIDAPASGATVSGTVAIRAHATDDVTVKTIEVYVDGKRLVRKQGATLTRNWNAKAAAVKPGPHTITVNAYDDDGNVGTASIVVRK